MAGLRDAFALGWRLNAILEGKVGVDVLDSYTTERKEHAKHYINFSQELGKIICISDPQAAAERDRVMKAELVARNFKPVPTDICQLGPGAWCADAAHAGELSVQGVVEANGKRDRFDQAVGFGWIVLGLDADPSRPWRRTAGATGGIGRATVKIGRWKYLRCGGCRRHLCQMAKWYRCDRCVVAADFYVAATAATAEELRHRFAR